MNTFIFIKVDALVCKYVIFYFMNEKSLVMVPTFFFLKNSDHRQQYDLFADGSQDSSH